MNHPKGEPQNPLTNEEFLAKYEDCASYAHYDERTASQIKDLILNLGDVGDVSQFTTLLGI